MPGKDICNNCSIQAGMAYGVFHGELGSEGKSGPMAEVPLGCLSFGLEDAAGRGYPGLNDTVKSFTDVQLENKDGFPAIKRHTGQSP